MLHAAEEQSVSETHIAVGLQFDRTSPSSTEQLETIKARLLEEAMQQQGRLDHDLMFERENSVANELDHYQALFVFSEERSDQSDAAS